LDLDKPDSPCRYIFNGSHCGTALIYSNITPTAILKNARYKPEFNLVAVPVYTGAVPGPYELFPGGTTVEGTIGRLVMMVTREVNVMDEDLVEVMVDVVVASEDVDRTTEFSGA